MLRTGDAYWAGRMPPVGATIAVIKASNPMQWELDMSTFGDMANGEASEFVSSRPFNTDPYDLPIGARAVWDGACFRINTGLRGDGECLDKPPPDAPAPKPPPNSHLEQGPNGPVWVQDSLAPPAQTDPGGHWEDRPKGKVWVQDKPASDPNTPPPIPANAKPGHWEHRLKGWVWVHDKAPSKGPVMSNNAKADTLAGYTHYLCYVDENGHEGACSTMTLAQTKLATDAINATPVGAEDRVAGVIRVIDPYGKWGPNKYRIFLTHSFKVSLLQWNAIQAAIAANPAAGVPTPLSQEGGGGEGATPKEIETHVNIGVRILEGLAAAAAAGFVVFEIWKHSKKRAA